MNFADSDGFCVETVKPFKSIAFGRVGAWHLGNGFWLVAKIFCQMLHPYKGVFTNETD
jgi:hypothetical protein